MKLNIYEKTEEKPKEKEVNLRLVKCGDDGISLIMVGKDGGEINDGEILSIVKSNNKLSFKRSRFPNKDYVNRRDEDDNKIDEIYT